MKAYVYQNTTQYVMKAYVYQNTTQYVMKAYVYQCLLGMQNCAICGDSIPMNVHKFLRMFTNS